MNLAEIRKKANRERDVAVQQPREPRHVQAASPAQFPPLSPAADAVQVPPAHEELFDFTENPEAPESKPVEKREPAPSPLPPEVPQAVAPEVISTPSIAAATALEYLPPVAISGSEPQDISTPQAVSQHIIDPCHSHFDPLAVLLAGRAAAGCDEDTPLASLEAVETETSDFQEFLCFRVASEQYAINIMEIKEIIKPREITEVPRSPQFIAGIISLRGLIIPVFDLRERLQLVPSGQTGKERIVVLCRGEELFGVQVDEVQQVVRIAESAIELPPSVLEGIDRDFVQGIGRTGGDMIILLNLASILDITLC
jgi:purine-binding chemotaxis protein CheW